MNLLWAGLIVLAFAAILERLRLPARAKEVGGHARATLRVFRDPALDDGAKERLLRRHAVRLFVLAGVIILGGVAALAAPLAVIWLLEQVGAASFSEVLSILERVDFLLAATVLGVGTWAVLRMRRG